MAQQGAQDVVTLAEVLPPSRVPRPAVVHEASPGGYRGVSDLAPVDLRSSGIIYQQIEAGSLLFWWEGHGFRQLQLSE